MSGFPLTDLWGLVGRWIGVARGENVQLQRLLLYIIAFLRIDWDSFGVDWDILRLDRTNCSLKE